MKTKKHSRASALLLATILLFAILTVIISLSSVTVMEMKMSQKGKTSVASFYDAESGVEWALHKVTTTNGNIKGDSSLTINDDGSITCPTGVGSAGCKVYFLKADGTAMTKTEINTAVPAPTFADVQAVRAIGREGNDTQRAIEAAVASGNCPSGFTDTSYGYCIQTNRNSVDTMHWLEASADCAVTYSARLCTAGEWYTAYEKGKANAMIQTNTWEWTSDADYVYDTPLATPTPSSAGIFVFGNFGSSPSIYANAAIGDTNGYVRCCSDYK